MRRTAPPRPARPRRPCLRARQTCRRAAPAEELCRRRAASALPDCLESLPVDAHDRSDGHKGLGVDGLDEFEDHRGLPLAADHHDDFGLLFRIPPLRVDERHPAVDVVDDRLGHFLVVVRDDEDLARLLVSGHDHIDRVTHDGRHHVAVNHGADAHAHQQGRTDDDEIGVDEDFAVADRAVLVDDHGHDVRAARRAALREAERDAGAGQNTAHDDGQQVVDPEEVAIGKHLLPEVHAQGDDHHAEDGLETEIPPHDKSGDHRD